MPRDQLPTSPYQNPNPYSTSSSTGTGTSTISNQNASRSNPATKPAKSRLKVFQDILAQTQDTQKAGSGTSSSSGGGGYGGDDALGGRGSGLVGLMRKEGKKQTQAQAQGKGAYREDPGMNRNPGRGGRENQGGLRRELSFKDWMGK